ncbi:Abi family protein [Clostridiales bacterium AF36-10]|nr:Abi family protein [Clostridium sp. AM22-16AC]RHO03289.1 Abi family protein [Clostridium sp. AM22-16AC]RJW85234.1 Abi family protein [Clostridiales bacterium AF36-10]
MDAINYMSIDDQIEKLKSQNMTFFDVDSAKMLLARFGYSNIIKSYRDPYVIVSNEKKTFRSGVSFEQVYSLYLFDKNLRTAVMATMLDLEEYIKEITANIVAQSFGTHQDQYLQYRNYQNKRKTKYRFSLPGLLDTLKKTLETDKEPIHHYMEKYGMVPPWILFKSVYFSTIINYIDQLKAREQHLIVQQLYTLNDQLSEEAQVRLMMDTLYISLEYRNMAAHGGRIYNYHCKRQIPLAPSEATSPGEGFCQLLQLLDLLDYKDPVNNLHSVLDREINRHCQLFPQDTTYLGQILNLNITSRNIVWVSGKSKIYHLSQHCSGMKNATEIDLEKVQELGFKPCCRCWF